MIVLTTIIILCYLCYSAWVMDGIPESLSATYYGLKEDGWMFQLLCLGLGFGLLPNWLDACNGEYEYLPFLACAGLSFVGIAPAFKMKLEGVIHYTAAAICCTSAVIWQVLEKSWGTLSIYGIIGLICCLLWKKKWCWWLETCVIGSVLTALLQM